MRSVLTLLTLVTLAFGTPAYSQDSHLRHLAKNGGLWVSVDNGEQVQFNMDGLGNVTATLPGIPGLATVSNSTEHGANVKISARGIDCFYTLSPIGPREFSWGFKYSPAGTCPGGFHFKKDPAWD
jgi:hypothetical protein